MREKKIGGKPAPITWGVVNYYPYQVKNLKDTMKDLTIEQEAIMQLIQELYVLRTTVIAGKTVEERVKESNTVPEDAMIKEEENKKLKENIAWYEKEEDRLREENKNLKEINESQNEEIQRFKDNAMQDMREITELELENKKLKEENKKLKEERIFSLGEYDYMILTSTTPQLKIIKKNQNYSLMEEDTLQELRDIGEI